LIVSDKPFRAQASDPRGLTGSGLAALLCALLRNALERLNQELKRRTHVMRIFPAAESCWWLVRALAVEMHEN
jgi:hypothetical protein